MLSDYSLVKLVVDLPEENLKAGAVGVTLMSYAAVPPPYEVEIMDADGGTLALVTLTETQLSPVTEAEYSRAKKDNNKRA